MIAGLVRYTGLDAKFIDPKKLVVAKGDFTDHLLEDKGLELGRYDSREVLPRRQPGQQWGPRQDPSLRPMVDLMEGSSPPLIRYLRDTLGYHSDLLYRGPCVKFVPPGRDPVQSGGLRRRLDGVDVGPRRGDEGRERSTRSPVAAKGAAAQAGDGGGAAYAGVQRDRRLRRLLHRA